MSNQSGINAPETNRAIYLETRKFQQVLASLPELFAAMLLLYTWLWPLRAGYDAVVSSLFLLAIEFPMLGCLFMLHGSRLKLDLSQRAIFLLGAFACLGLTYTITIEFQSRVASTWYVYLVVATVIARAMSFRESTVSSTPVVEMAKEAILGCVLMMAAVFSIDNLPAPHLGIDNNALANLAFPDPGPVRLYVRRSELLELLTHPWTFLAAGTFYYLTSAALRYFLTTRQARQKR